MDDSLDIITVFNPDTEPFHIVYNNQSYGYIEPQKARRMARFIAKLAVKHLIDQVLNRLQLPTNNQSKRDELAAKIILEEEVYALPSPVSQDEKIRQDMEALNKNQDLDRILAKRKAAGAGDANPNFTPQPMVQPPPPPAPPPPASVTPSTTPVANTAPIMPPQPPADLGVAPPDGASKVLKEVDNTEPAAPETGTPPNGNADVKPSREQIYTYAEKVMGMTLTDPKTKAALDEIQDLDKLAEVVGYDAQAAI